MNATSLALPLAFGSALLLSFSAQPAEQSFETITFSSTSATRPLPHFWEVMFGSGRAVLTLRESWRKDAAAAKAATGLQYVRFHAIFHDEMGVYDEDQQGKSTYNFSYVDQVYDGMLDLGIKPFVELGFMPRKLAANLEPHPFWYKPFPSPPKDQTKWNGLIAAFVNHLIERYGREEVETWYFEVWNEPNIDFWNGRPALETYLALYDGTARTVKNIDAKIRVGGPATAQAAWIDKFIAHCTENKVPFDFVSTHVYGNDVSEDVFGTHEKIPRRSMVARSARKVHDQVLASAAPTTPIFWTEYNATYMNQPEVTDSAFMGPWLANNIRECAGLVTYMSYWDVSDVFEEQGVVKKPFYGGYGLSAERNIPKASLRDFELLHKLGDQQLTAKSENAIVTKRSDGAVVIALWNYAEPGESVAPKSFRLAPGQGYAQYRLQMVGPNQASSWDRWKQLGSPVYPTKAQIGELQQASALLAPVAHSVNDPITLPAETLAVIELTAK